MNESQFHALADELMNNIEDALDDAESDLDYVNNSGLLTITCESGVQIIVSRQAPLCQLWLASPAGGERFVYGEIASQWHLEGDAGQSFASVLALRLEAYAGETFELADI